VNGRLNELGNYIIFVRVHTKLDDSIPIFAGKVVLVHPLDDFIDSSLQNIKQRKRKRHRAAVYQWLYDMRV
jgi:hypothetical protein